MPGKTILIVEDDDAISNMYQTKLKQQGYNVLIASDGYQGLETAKKEKPDLILLDVILPQIDGFSVLEELKKIKETKDLPIIMLTNLSTNEDKDKAEKLGATNYIVKANITPADLSIAVEKIFKS
jgi:DNA-binding response OmpR family regulator